MRDAVLVADMREAQRVKEEIQAGLKQKKIGDVKVKEGDTEADIKRRKIRQRKKKFKQFGSDEWLQT